MNQASIRDILTRIEEMRVSVANLSSTFVSGELAEADQRYLTRCMDLLQIELTAIREYVERME